MGREKGELLYRIYRSLTYGVQPLLFLHLQWRRLLGLEHPFRWSERFGYPSSRRPLGPLIYFHAVSLGEGLAAIPIIKHCVQQRPDLAILMTTTSSSASEVIKDRLPYGVIHQFAPIDTPAAVDSFLGYWNPIAIFLMENELWPNLIISASRIRIPLALLNARMSTKSFNLWSIQVVRPLISLILSKFSLISSLQSTVEAIRYQLLEAPTFAVHFVGDLKYAAENFEISDKENAQIQDLQLQLGNRPVWIAASLHKGEEEAVLRAHKELFQLHPTIVTIIVPRYPKQGQQIARDLLSEGMNVSLRSKRQKISAVTQIYIVDLLGELRNFYRLSQIAVIGGSFFPGFSGHNIFEAAAAGCAVLTGLHVGHFSDMIQKMQRLNPLSVQQVPITQLGESLVEIFGNAEVLEARRQAAKEAFLSLSSGVIENYWNLINIHVLRDYGVKSDGGYLQ